MSWSQVTFVVDDTTVDSLSSLLDAFLASAVTTENAGEDEFYEVAFPGIPDWKKVKVTALFDERIDVDPILEYVQNQYPEQEIPIDVSKLVDQDWERVWLTSFKPIEVGQDLWVCPTWCEPTQPEARNIVLDPGLAFGTGTHATTYMCLRWLAEQNLDNQQVLDYGSGSGILAIAALLSNAKHADAVDIDPLAVKACTDNADRNGVANKMSSYLPSGLPESPAHRYDLVIANILAEVIIELRDTLLLHLKPRGTLLLTGILDSQAERVKKHFGKEFDFEQQKHEHWTLLVAKYIGT